MDDFSKVLNYSFLLLKYHSRTEKEIRDKLAGKKYGKNTIARTINRLKELKFVDDKKFAAEFVKYQLEKGKGIILIRHELSRRGVNKETLEEIIEALGPDEQQEYEKAKELFDKKLKHCKDMSPNKVYSQVSGFLARRGFSVETINKIFRNWRTEFRDKLI